MLVVSRKLGEEILLPSLGITIRISEMRQSKVKISIQAPEEIKILRGELRTKENAVASAPAATYPPAADPQPGPMRPDPAPSDRSSEVNETSAGYRIARSIVDVGRELTGGYGPAYC